MSTEVQIKRSAPISVQKPQTALQNRLINKKLGPTVRKICQSKATPFANEDKPNAGVIKGNALRMQKPGMLISKVDANSSKPRHCGEESHQM
jgi:mRNA-degrading endonuclease toxin of MazEF toxin-antitoxin module